MHNGNITENSSLAMGNWDGIVVFKSSSRQVNIISNNKL